MNYKIVSDSSSDLRELSEIDFESAPLKIITDNKEYIDDASLDVVGMLSDLKTYKGKSRSSCPNSEEYLRAFGDVENIFCITITSNLSGSFNSASIAAKQYKEAHPDCNIHVIDSLTTGPETALVIEKLRSLILEGEDFESIKEEITDYNTNHTRLLFALESMHNLANNGRVNPIVAKMAGLLGIRAIGRASDVGTLEMICKSRGPVAMVNDIFANMVGDGYKGGRVKIHHANNLSATELLISKIRESYPDAQIDVGFAGGLCSFYAEQGGLLIGFEI
ncbi:MAG: DegV family protein [Clostridia bacterium]|nr:DegV family protein [Clostridia bacterium]